MILYRVLKRHIVLVIFIIVFGGLVAFLDAFVLRKAGNIIDALTKSRNLIELSRSVKIFVFIMVLSVIIQFLLALYLALVKKKIVFETEYILFRHLLYAKPQVFYRFNSGDLLERIGSNTRSVSNIIGQNLLNTIRSATFILFSLWFIFRIHPLFGIFFLLFIFLFTAVSLFFATFIQKVFYEYYNTIGKKQSFILEVIHGFITIKMLSSWDFIFNRFKIVLSKTVKRMFKSDILLFSSLVVVVAVVSAFVILWFIAGSHLVKNNILTLGEFLSAFALFVMSNQQFNTLNNSISVLKQNLASLKRVNEFLGVKEEILISSKMVFRNQISFKNITFGFDDKKILKNVSFEIRKGEFVGIKGKTGAGKSTLLYIIAGLFIPQEGDILIDGLKLTEDQIVAYRKLIGFLPQQPFILNASLRENIVFGRPFDEDKYLKVIRQAGLQEFIEKPDYMERYILEGGKNLSGGERQRIHLARVLYGDHEIYVFDEPTSNVDLKTEKIIYNTLIDLIKNGKTVVVCSHKNTLLKGADKIVELENGMIKHIKTGGKEDEYIEKYDKP